MDDGKLDQIARLFALKEKGVLSEDEYAKEKIAILGKADDSATNDVAGVVGPDFSPTALGEQDSDIEHHSVRRQNIWH